MQWAVSDNQEPVFIKRQSPGGQLGGVRDVGKPFVVEFRSAAADASVKLPRLKE